MRYSLRTVSRSNAMLIFDMYLGRACVYVERRGGRKQKVEIEAEAEAEAEAEGRGQRQRQRKSQSQTI